MEREELLSILSDNQEFISFMNGDRDNFCYFTDIARFKVTRNDNNEIAVRYKCPSVLTENERSMIEDTLSLLPDICS